MATKFYIHNASPVYAPATYRGAWDDTAGVNEWPTIAAGRDLNAAQALSALEAGFNSAEFGSLKAA